MPFMMLILLFLLAAVVWAFFHYNPRGVDTFKLMLVNIATLLFAALAAVAVAYWIYGGARALPADRMHMAWYLTIMAGGAAFLIVVTAAGVIRNMFMFPLSSRQAETPR